MTTYNIEDMYTDIKNAIKVLSKEGYEYIDTKIIKKVLGIPPSDMAKTQYIWRALDYFQKIGILEGVQKKTRK